MPALKQRTRRSLEHALAALKRELAGQGIASPSLVAQRIKVKRAVFNDIATSGEDNVTEEAAAGTRSNEPTPAAATNLIGYAIRVNASHYMLAMIRIAITAFDAIAATLLCRVRARYRRQGRPAHLAGAGDRQ